ncbi:WD40 repeat domain-containing serine/threonine protein kinase [Tautonia plasticadhaerens]|uniref:Serine/threonine-protein kinase PknD n=1 Tax=Tautonia plasticadhaerens TaxID=2527974 RepID=A0A518GYZ3_9BACT|nr:protein kinase [Tautonia plasticadhaerens]QDV33840.1 Serine/threonine-protein kinase PknD [Tautonia plasticadhaerens]
MARDDADTSWQEEFGPDDREALSRILRALVEGRLDLDSTVGRLIEWRTVDDPSPAVRPTTPGPIRWPSPLRGDGEGRASGADPGPEGRDGPATAESGPGADGPGPGEAGGWPVTGGRFEVRTFLARGGLGEVYVAFDREVGREVALKVMRPDRSSRGVRRDRFLMEAEITGQLEHPGIVPIYAIGLDDRGGPFYAMRLIRGRSLLQALSTCDRGRGFASSLEFRGLVARFLAACDAVSYAHSRGVLHRDLKPSNILCGPFGETIVVDWGLAKPVGDPGPEIDRRGGASGTGPGPDDPGPPGPARPPSAGGTETRPGTVVGTPGYMSPEQARGGHGAPGPASDVYSLGATLYHLAVGRVPIDAADLAEALDRTRLGEFERPRRANRGIPRALEAIILRAMANRPEDRYPSASGLAAELRRWLADEPVICHREGGVERLSRWSRKHRALAGAAVLALAAVAAVASVSALAVAGALRSAELAGARAEEAGRRARAEGARLTLDRALYLCQLGDVHAGLLWLAEALRLDDEAGLGDGPTIRANLAAWGRQLGEVVRAIPHPEHLAAVAVSPDGDRMATACHDGLVRVWDPDTEGPPIALRHEGPATVVAFTPGGALISGDGSGWVIAWDLGRRAPRWRLRALAACAAIAVSPDGSACVVSGRDGDGVGVARLVDLGGGTLIGEPMRHEGSVAILDVAYRPDGLALATAGHDGTVRTWDARTGAPGPLRLGHPMPAQVVAYSPDGARLLTGCRDGRLRTWDAGLGVELAGPRPAHLSGISGLEFRPDGRVLLTVGWDATARLWDAATGRPIGPELPHHLDLAAGTFFPDGRRIATVSNDFVARVWAAPPGPPNEPILRPGGSIRHVSYRPDGRAFLTGDDRGRSQLWDAGDLSPIGGPMVHPGGLARMEFDESSRRLLTFRDRRIMVWDAREGGPTGLAIEAPIPLIFPKFAAGGDRIVAVAIDGRLSCWDSADGRPAWGPVDVPLEPDVLITSPDGRSAWVGGGGGTMIELEVETGRISNTVAGLGATVLAMAVTPDGETALAGLADGRAVLIDLSDGARLGPEMAHRAPLAWVGFDAEGGEALTESGGVLRRWDARTGAPIGPMLPHLGPTIARARDAGLRTVLTGQAGGDAMAWDVASGRAIGPPLEHLGPVSGLAIHPDGSEALSCDGTGTVYRWRRPAPMSGEPGRVNLAVEVRTGMALVGDAALPLDLDGWRSRRARLDGPSPPDPGTPDPSPSPAR